MPHSNAYRRGLAASALLVAAGWVVAGSAVPQGSEAKAQKYYEATAEALKFPGDKKILESILSDVPRYLGYGGLSARDLERLSPAVLMDHTALGSPCGASPASPAQPCETAVEAPAEFTRATSVVPLRAGDILSSRFLAPKIANVSQPAATRPLGWRKLVRLLARRGSEASKHGISAGIVLFNFFTQPGARPFTPEAESVNTQVMLLTTRTSFASGGKDSLYWLDYGPLSAGGKLSLKLDASFDAADFQGSAQAIKPYFVPDGCVACHGQNETRPMVNYLDTDHWFDRIDDDFTRARDDGLPVLFDGGTDPSRPEFARAFDVIRQFNEEAEAQAAMAQPKSFHRKASRGWLQLHEASNEHVPAIKRAIQSRLRWNAASQVDQELLPLLNRYCFRCHGTIKFNVFDKTEVFARRGPMATRLSPTDAQMRGQDSFLMPPDRKLDDAERDRLLRLLRALEGR